MSERSLLHWRPVLEFQVAVRLHTFALLDCVLAAGIDILRLSLLVLVFIVQINLQGHNLHSESR